MFCIIILTLLGYLYPLTGRQIYIVDGNHPAASDSNPGTEEYPLKTIQAGIQRIKAGDTLWIRAGVYRETVTITRSGKPEVPIVVEAFPGDEGQVIISGSNSVVSVEREQNGVLSFTWNHQFEVTYPDTWPDFGELAHHLEMVFVGGKRLEQVFAPGRLQRGTFYTGSKKIYFYPYTKQKLENLEVSARKQGLVINGAYIQIRALIIEHVANDYRTGAVDIRGHDITLENNFIRNNSLDGIKIRGHNHVLRNNIVMENGGIGISGSTHHSVYEGNIVQRNSWRIGSRWHAGGIKIIGGYPGNNNIVSNNLCFNNGPGVWLDTVGKNNMIARNSICSNTQAGVKVEASSGRNYIVNNLIYDNRVIPRDIHEESTGSGILIYESSDVVIVHNTIVENDGAGLVLAGGIRERQGHTPSLTKNITFKNNVIAFNRNGQLRLWLWKASKKFIKTHHFDCNAWGIRDSNFGFLGSGTRPLKLSYWRDNLEYDKNSVALDNEEFLVVPGFVPHYLSSIVDKGCRLPFVTEDIRGMPRPQGVNVDIGAYEVR